MSESDPWEPPSAMTAEQLHALQNDLERRETELREREDTIREVGRELLQKERAFRERLRDLERREQALQSKQNVVSEDSRPIDVSDAEFVETVEDSMVSKPSPYEAVTTSSAPAERMSHTAQTGVQPSTSVEAISSSGETQSPQTTLPPLGTLLVFAQNQQVALYARLEEAFADPQWTLRIHFFAVRGVPVFVLVLRAQDGESHHQWHRPLNSRQHRDRVILESLRKKFRAQILWGHADAIAHEADIEVRMESNMLRGLDRSARLPVMPNIDFDAHAELALAELASLPALPAFLGAEAQSLAELLEHVASVRAYADPDAFDPILLAHGVPEINFIGSMRRTISSAVETGLWLPPALLSRAQEAGLGASRENIAAEMLQTFVRKCEDSSASSLSQDAMHENLRQLIARAQELGAELDPEAVERAWHILFPLRPTLEQLRVEDLQLAAEHPKLRVPAIQELCVRYRAARLEDTVPSEEYFTIVFGALTRASRTDMLALVPAIAALGDQIGEQLLALLDNSRLHIRMAAAAILSKHRMRRALVALTSLLLHESTDAWKEIARGLASFGASAAKPLCRAVADRKNPRNRVAYALALLQALHPDAKEIIETEAQESDPALLVALKGVQPFAMEHLRIMEIGALEGADEYQSLGIEIAAALNQTVDA